MEIRANWKWNVSSKHIIAVFATFVLGAMLSVGMPARAGTTGMLTGAVVDENGHPVAGASVIAMSPVAIVQTVTASDGRFVYLALIPGTYVVSVERRGYEPVASAGITIVADQNRTLGLATRRIITQWGGHFYRLPSALVQPMLVPDLYRLTPTQQQKLAVAGGGNGLNNALSALSTVPGVSVAPGTENPYRR
jgi:hypothetical protein